MVFRRWFYLSCLKLFWLFSPALFLMGCAGGDSESSVAGGRSVELASLSWVAPSERSDGSALELSAISGYRVYYGEESGNYRNKIEINDGSVVQAQLDDIPEGKYYVVVTTVDMNGRESAYSVEVVLNL